MSSQPERWEYGGEFDWPQFPKQVQDPSLPSGAVLFGSGRDAIRAVLEHGITAHGWNRCFVPHYYCGDVLPAIKASGLRVAWYEDLPTRSSILGVPDLSQRDVILLVNYFGLRGPAACSAVASSTIYTIEDHSHDLWGEWCRTSHAHYCIASLRKTLPLPGGGAAWSPRGCSLPPVPQLSVDRERATGHKLQAMLLKTLYISGHAVEKQCFRELQAAGEAAIGSGELSGTTTLVEAMLHLMPGKTWRRRRCENHELLAQAVADLPSITILRPDPESDTCSLGLVMVFDDPVKRESVRQELIAKSVYSTVLWPIPRECPLDRCLSAGELARRILLVPCDHRYRAPEVERTATLLRDVILH